ncbi:hypothetical protein CXB51_021283 [Gossypium anomalum]|uniref:DUF7745 domain-containing protein n=1 Tax=Gossypium anomalum TaxID=47600 RepID=A0A8J5YYC4_9ROSI|nr:hypothetical protein CXB51_021283 [Gossypium anomalum]
MEKGFLDKVEDNVTVRIWAKTTQQEKGDSLRGRRAPISSTRPVLEPCLQLLHFRESGLVPTVEEFTAVLHSPKIQVDKAYSRAANVSIFSKKLMNVTRMTYPDIKKRVDVFALSICGLVIFPKALGHIDEAIFDLFDKLSKRVTPAPTILAKTFRSLNACRRAGEGRFTGCAQLLLVWFHSHFWKVEKVSYRIFSKNYSLLKELVATPRRDDITEEKWITILQNLQEKDIE